MEQNFTPGLGDSHFHILEMQRKGLNPLPLMDTWFQQGFSYLLDAGVDMEGWTLRSQAAESHRRLFLASGWHPHCAGIAGFFFDWEAFHLQLSHKKTLAVGEIGLDYYRNPQNKKEQRHLFISQLEKAKEVGKPVIIHNREADSDLLGILKEADLETTGVFHCFSSDLETARKALDLGYYLSFSGNVTYPSAEQIREAAKFTPADRMFVETDSPYLSPVPHRGKNNSPPWVEFVLEKVSLLKGQSPLNLAQSMEGNFRRLFNPQEW